MVIVRTVATESLISASWTLLSVAAKDVKLAFANTAVGARIEVASPGIFLVAVADPAEIGAANAKTVLDQVAVAVI